MRAIVTGAAGFLGRYVARAAAHHGYHVTGIGHGPSGREDLIAWGVQEWYNSDVTLEALQSHANGAEIIFHCAGGASVAQSLEDPIRDFRRTVDSTLSVLEFLRLQTGEAKLVITSSAGVYGKVNSTPIRIDTALHPASPYGLHKKIAEDLCRCYGVNFGVRTAIVRLFSVYGPELRKQLLWDACGRLSRGENEFAGTGEETRDWLHVEDAAELIMASARHASSQCPTVNGGTGVSATVRQIVERIGVCLPDVPKPRFSGEKRGGDPDHYLADSSEARAWGWAPRHNWQEGVAEYVSWYQGAQR